MINFRNGTYDDESDLRAVYFQSPAKVSSPARHPEVVTTNDRLVFEIASRDVIKMLHGFIGHPHRVVVEHSGLNEVVERIADRWALSGEEVAQLLGSESAETAADYVALRGRDAQDRVENLFRIFEAVFGLFHDANAEREWIRHPAESLGGKSCLERMLQGGIEDLVHVRRVIEHIAGR